MLATRTLLGAVLGLLAVSSAAAQTFVGQNFTGSTFLTDSNFRTPDTMGAAGVDYFVELINGRFSVYRKSDGARVQTSTLNQFWNNAGQTPSGVNGAFDPRVMYDPHARRWYAVAVDNGQNANNFLFAVSSSSDPTQSWSAFKIDSDTDDSNWADFPMLGYNPEAVFVSANMPTLTASDARTSYLVFSKFDLLQPVPTIANMHQLEDVSSPIGTNAWSPQLAVDASNLIGINTTLPVLRHDFVTGDLSRAEIVSPGSPSVVNVGLVGVPAGLNPPTVDQPGPKQNIEANDGRFSSNTVLHNGQLYGVQAIDDMSAVGRAAVRFVRLDAATNAVLESQIIVDPASRALTFPSIAVNEFGDVVIGVTGTSTTEFPSSYALVGKTVAGLTTFNAPLLLQAGVSDYLRLDSNNKNRWGDYSATTVDPADPSIFWTSQEFVSSTDHWSTQVTELIVLQPNEVRWAEPLDGVFDDPTRWLTAHGGAPQPTDHLIFSRATVPGGSYTVVFPSQPAGVYSYQSVSGRQGNAVLDLAGNQLDLSLHLEVGPYYGDPQLTIANGTVNSPSGLIAAVRPTSAGTLILDNAHWNVVGDVIVGSPPDPNAPAGFPGSTGGVGVLTIDNNSQLDIGGTLRIGNAGTVHLNGGVLTAPTIETGPVQRFNFTGGTLHADTIVGELKNTGGTLAPGSSIGSTNIVLGYFQEAGGTLAIEIGGVSQFDRLIAALMQLDGKLEVSLLAGFQPQLGDAFDILDFGALFGQFALLQLPSLAGGRVWNTSQLYTSGVISVMAHPGDFDSDGDVDGADFVAWQTHFPTASGATLADGDADGDGDVDGADFVVWQTNFPYAPGPGSAPVPEPHSIFLLAASCATLFFRRSTGKKFRSNARRRQHRFEGLENRAMLSVNGDFNGDGYDDLVIGAVNEVVWGIRIGAVTIIYGSRRGLTATNNQTWHLNSPGVDGVPNAVGLFGYALAIGDFNGDGRDDLAIGAPTIGIPGEKAGPLDAVGAVQIIYGFFVGGLIDLGNQFWSQGDLNSTDGIEFFDSFGAALG